VRQIMLLVASAIVGIAIGWSSGSWVFSGEVQSPTPNVDFPMMAIATRPFDAVESGGTARVRVNTLERCALGVTTCGAVRTVEAVCLGSARTVLIGSADWPAFRRLPAEDLPGVLNTPVDMRLCREDGTTMQ